MDDEHKTPAKSTSSPLPCTMNINANCHSENMQLKTVIALLAIQLMCYTITKAETLQVPANGLGAKGTRVNVTALPDWPSTESFLANFAKTSKPVIVQGAARDWPAYHKWTDEYLLRYEEEGMKEGVTVEQAKKEDREHPATEHSFYKFVSQYQKEDWYMVNGVPSFLRKDVIIPPPFQCPQMADLLLEQMMWFSSGGTKSVLHFDSMDNIHCLIAGRKLFILISPKNKVDIDQPQGSYSSVDVDNVDYEKYPDLLNLEYHYANLTAGDCLYVPFHWYHQVRGIDRNIAINIWWDHYTMMTQDLSECTEVPTSNHKTMDQVHFHGTAKLIQNEDAIKSHFLMLASQGGTPLTFDRLLFMFLGSEEQRPEMDDGQKAVAFFQSIFNILDQNSDGKIVADEVETLPKERWEGIRKELQGIQQFFQDNAREEEILEGDDTNHPPQDWDDTQYDTYEDPVFLEDQDTDYVDFYPSDKDEL